MCACAKKKEKNGIFSGFQTHTNINISGDKKHSFRDSLCVLHGVVVNFTINLVKVYKIIGVDGRGISTERRPAGIKNGKDIVYVAK